MTRDSPFAHQVELETHEAHIDAGRMFTISAINSLADNASFNLLMRVASGYQANVYFEATAGGAAIVRLYESPVIDVASLGTSLQSRRRNRTKPLTAVSSMFANPVVNASSLGSELFVEYLPGGSQGQTAGSGRAEVDKWVLSPATDYLYRITNVSGGATGVGLLLELYEIPVSALQ